MILRRSFPVADEVALAAGDATDFGAQAPQVLVQGSAARSVEQAKKERTLILVVDDHSTNRMVLKRQLISLGYAAEAVSDGRQALAAWKTGRFALVIADCNMPEMSGYQLSRAIRAHENVHGLHRTPIFACTANAMPSEIGICREAGVDEYIVKPAGLQALAKHLGRWLPLPGRRGHAGEPIDHALLDSMVGGDAAIKAEVIRDYRSVQEADAVQLADSVERGDFKLAGHLVHRIRGACLAFGSLPLGEACGLLEEAIRGGDTGMVNDAMAAVRAESDRLLRALDRLREAPDGSVAAAAPE